MSDHVLALSLSDRLLLLAVADVQLLIETRFRETGEAWASDSDVLDVSGRWTTSDPDAECAQDFDGVCRTHADEHALGNYLTAYLLSLTA